MNNIYPQIQMLLTQVKANTPIALIMVLSLWAIHFVNFILGYRLNFLGVYPRHLWGLIGIPFYTFLHRDFNHLFFNSIPLFVLIVLLLINGMPSFICATVTIILLAGIALWFLGRPGFHIGASCLIMGYFSYLLINAYQHPDIITVVLVLVFLYYFGSLIGSLLPVEERTSWEGHIFGFLAGLAANYTCHLPMLMKFFHGTSI